MTDTQSSTRENVLDELRWRGAIAQTTDEESLRAALEEGPITVYCGFDPTAPSLHFGNFVQLVALRRFQQAGHRVICLVGGSTGQIGDPKATAERVLKSREQTAHNVARIKALVAPFLDFDGSTGVAHPARLVDNLDWFGPLTALEFLRDVGKHFRVNQMIRKDAIAARLESQEGISYTEFSYQLLQAYDFLELYRSLGCTLQIGGSDQWGNLVAGVDLIHRVEGAAVHVLTSPLLTDSSGTKFGKSEGNAIWLSADMTTPYAFYQYFLNIEDASVIELLRVFTDFSRAEVAELETQVAEQPFRRTAQRALAAEMTTLVHGLRAAEAARAASEALFGRGDLTLLDEDTLRDAIAELPGGAVEISGTVTDALVATGLVESRNAARRAVGDGAVSLNGAKVSDADQVLGKNAFLHGVAGVLRKGKKNLAAVRPRT
ncbi:MAG: tyrosine--tRNA ligase [Intrasporangiaceae bacterium]|nr:tyrosine--tRNA ligase [Intrasporangiaceae bacterium]